MRIPPDAVAVVDGKPISKSTFTHWFTIAAARKIPPPANQEKAVTPVVPQPPAYSACIQRLREHEAQGAQKPAGGDRSKLKSECAQDYLASKAEAMRFLINADWQIGEAERRHVAVSRKALEAEFLRQKKAELPKPGEFKALLIRTGQTVSDILLVLKVQRLEKALEARVTAAARPSPSNAEVHQYYATHEPKFGKPERRELNLIIAKTKAEAEKAKREVQQGAAFRAVGKRFTEPPWLKKRGSVLEIFGYEGQGQATERFFEAKPQALTGPVKGPEGYDVFEVTKVLEPQPKPFAEVAARARADFIQEAESEALARYHWTLEKAWAARTSCRSGYIVEDCGNFKGASAGHH